MTEVDIRAHERVGTVLNDKWTLERVLGVGGMAAVYAARHRNGARAAVKVLHADLSRQAEVRERFLREGYAANRVEHPGVVKVLDDDVVASGADTGTAYLVMELLEGESLQDRLERNPPMGEREFLVIAASVLDVLEAAHARGVVHRDLKPENLFLLREREEDTGRVRVKVLDFGLARLLQGQAITSYGLALGTPSFMSPEQAAGRVDEVDGRTDLFALAATGFRLRTGRRIHEGINAVELVTKMANVAAPRVRTVAPTVSEAFAQVVDRALEFRREDRYESAAAMRDDVFKAIAKLDAGVTATQLALPAPPLAERSGEPTAIEVSEGDFVHSEAPVEPRPQAQRASGLGSEGKELADDAPAAPVRRDRGSDERAEESINIPRRRSWLPLLALLAFAGLGAKLWFDARKAAAPWGQALRQDEPASAALPVPPAPPASLATAAVTASSSAALGAQARDGGSDRAAVSADAPAATVAAHTQPAVAAPPARTMRRPLPAKVGPGNVHKLPATHHTRNTGR
jgi:eukaryotic-like serine/threonine-protein kinase